MEDFEQACIVFAGIGLLLYLFLYYALYHTYKLEYSWVAYNEYRWRRTGRIKIPRWTILIVLVTLVFPILGIAIPVVVWIIYGFTVSDNKYEIDISLIKWLNKSIYDTNIRAPEKSS